MKVMEHGSAENRDADCLHLWLGHCEVGKGGESPSSLQDWYQVKSRKQIQAFFLVGKLQVRWMEGRVQGSDRQGQEDTAGILNLRTQTLVTGKGGWEQEPLLQESQELC